MRKDIKEAKMHLKKARKIAQREPSVFKGMSVEEAIKHMRKVRKKLWEQKVALRT